MLDAFVPIRCCSCSVPHDLLHLNKGYSRVCFFYCLPSYSSSGSLEPCDLPSPADFIIAALFFPKNQSNAMQLSVLSLAPAVGMEPAPTPSAFHCVLGLIRRCSTGQGRVCCGAAQCQSHCCPCHLMATASSTLGHKGCGPLAALQGPGGCWPSGSAS